jgi:hypothetical protein
MRDLRRGSVSSIQLAAQSQTLCGRTTSAWTRGALFDLKERSMFSLVAMLLQIHVGRSVLLSESRNKSRNN